MALAAATPIFEVSIVSTAGLVGRSLDAFASRLKGDFVTPANRPLTTQDYAVLPANGLQQQLADGDLVMLPTPDFQHQNVLGNLFRVLGTFVRSRKLGILLLAPFDVYLSPTTVLQPDLSFFDQDSCRFLSERGAEGPPALVVEVVSLATAEFDRGAKRTLFTRYGVKEIWIADPAAATMEILHLDDGRSRIFRETETLSTPRFAGLEIPLREVFA